MLCSQTHLGERSFKHRRNLLLFFIPSLVGLFLFMMPMSSEGGFTIPIALAAGWFKNLVDPWVASLLLLIITLSGITTVVAKVLKPACLKEDSFLKTLLMPTWPWAIIRLLGAVFVCMLYFNVGPDIIISENTGALLFHDFLPSLLAVFVFAGLFLPLLLNFGLLEFVSCLLTPIMRPIFKLPGRSAIDCGASWLGDGTVGILLTSKQYEQGHYTQREAAVIGTTFSLVSISFTLVIIEQVKLSHMVFPFYGTILIAGLVAAVIMPRIPPLSRKKDILITGELPKDDRDQIPEGYNALSYGYCKALTKVQGIQNPLKELSQGFVNSIEMVFGLLPVVLALGTVALVAAEYTPLFDWLGAPFLPLLEAMQIPEANEAARTIVVGFADMFLPSILTADIQSDMTRFIIAALSVTQLIYMSEVGALLLGSRLPVSLLEVVAVFLLRTLITLPIITLIAHWIF